VRHGNGPGVLHRSWLSHRSACAPCSTPNRYVTQQRWPQRRCRRGSGAICAATDVSADPGGLAMAHRLVEQWGRQPRNCRSA
jgi:hypothetical protein